MKTALLVSLLATTLVGSVAAQELPSLAAYKKQASFDALGWHFEFGIPDGFAKEDALSSPQNHLFGYVEKETILAFSVSPLTSENSVSKMVDRGFRSMDNPSKALEGVKVTILDKGVDGNVGWWAGSFNRFAYWSRTYAVSCNEQCLLMVFIGSKWDAPDTVARAYAMRVRQGFIDKSFVEAAIK